MNLIVAVTMNWAIGKNNNLVFRTKENMAFFRRMTQGKTIICGRKTLDSFPGGIPLPDRKNIVLTRNQDFKRDGVIVCHSKDEVIKKIAGEDFNSVMVVGGEEIYRLFLNECRFAFVTKFNILTSNADCFFPDLDENPDFSLLNIKSVGDFTEFCIYKNCANFRY